MPTRGLTSTLRTLFICVLLSHAQRIFADETPIRVGVLTKGNVEQTLRAWPLTINYLSNHIPGHVFQIVPLGFTEIGPAVERGELDFVLTNPASYVELEMHHGASSIATLKNLWTDTIYTTQFGGVIFVRKDRSDLKKLEDLKGHSFLAVNEKAFGGWSIARRELHALNIDPYRDFNKLTFAGNHEAVVAAVRSGAVDAGTIRSGVLEEMARTGTIELTDFRVLSAPSANESPTDFRFPFLHSTRLYPEWPFAKLRHTDDTLAEQVAIALMAMTDDDPAASAAQSAGWTIPLNYRPVHDLMRELDLGPYEKLNHPSLGRLVQDYWHWFAAMLAVVSALTGTTFYVLRLNRSVVTAKRKLEEHAQRQSRTEQVLRHSEERFRNLVETTNDLIWEIDSDGRYTYISPQIRKSLGYEPQEIIGSPITDPILQPAALPFTNRQPFVSFERVVHHKNGQPVTLECSGVPFFAVTGDFLGFRGISRDITQRKHTEEALFHEKERAQVTLESIADGVIRTDVKGNIEYINPTATYLTGWPMGEAIGQPLRAVLNLTDENSGSRVEDPITRTLHEGRGIHHAGTTLLFPLNGENNFQIELRAAPIRDHRQQIVGAVVVFHDVTEIRRLTQQMTYQASHDPLTELINRGEFEKRLEQAISHATRTSSHHVLCYLDVDQFKIVNDTCGHSAGDALLKQLAQRLQIGIREHDLLARLGGDEFGVLFMDCVVPQALDIVNELCRRVHEFRFSWENKVFQVGVSAGLAPIHSQSGSLSDVLAAADSACYVAKEQGRNRVHMYQPDDAEVAHRHGQMQWVPRIKHALDENRFRLYCEELIAITPAASHRRQFEILLRMIDEEGNEIAPMTFIPAAERYHLMPSVDRWVIAQTFEALAQSIQLHGLQHEAADAIFAINLSGQSIGDEQFLVYILALFDKTEIRPNRICFEITETAAIANLAKAIRFITILKNMGCCFALDDFGSGLSSFAYLKNLPVDYLKMDASFFHNSLNDQINYAMVDAINEIGHLMGLLTIAEGVQSDLGLERIKCIGIDYGQGHHISQATPLRDLLATGPTSLRRELVLATG